ncbi:type II toxin-antitoxin system Phd/YefM family antitoxin [Planctomycetota bacterium]
MSKRYSIAEARDNFTKLVHAAERGRPVEVTRRGKPVAVLLSSVDYARLTASKSGFLQACEAFRRQAASEDLAALHEALANVRDRSVGREVAL